MTKKSNSALRSTEESEHEEQSASPIPNTPPRLEQTSSERNYSLDERDFIKVAEAFGLRDFDAAIGLLEGVAKVFRPQGLNVDTANRLLAILHDTGPRDPIEGMIVTQMIAVNHAAMTMARRITDSENSVLETEVATNLATKLQRTFVALVEALHRYRSAGKQTVVVEHVHVHKGGQAVVGNVHSKGGGVHEK